MLWQTFRLEKTIESAVDIPKNAIHGCYYDNKWPTLTLKALFSKSPATEQTSTPIIR